MTRRQGIALFVVVGIPLLTGSCGGDCPWKLVFTLADNSGATGLGVRRIVAPDGAPLFVSAFPDETSEPGRADIYTACGAFPEEDMPGWIAEAWIDTDGSVDPESCELPGFPDGCRPDPGEPQDTVEFTFKGRGRTEVEVVLGEP